MYSTYYNSPLGLIALESTDSALTRLDFVEEKRQEGEMSEILKWTISELDEYFTGKRKEFTVPIYQDGTPFQKAVWNALRSIPFGKVQSYYEIAVFVGNPKAVRAVGMTNGRNPIGIIVPCHRVIGKNGKMVGYASGIWRKEWLLNHEQKFV